MVIARFSIFWLSLFLFALVFVSPLNFCYVSSSSFFFFFSPLLSYSKRIETFTCALSWCLLKVFCIRLFWSGIRCFKAVLIFPDQEDNKCTRFHLTPLNKRNSSLLWVLRVKNSDTIWNFMYCIDNCIEHNVGLSRWDLLHRWVFIQVFQSLYLDFSWLSFRFSLPVLLV